jgi:predicted small metal-binding protein
MKSFKCGDLVPGCPTELQADTDEEIMKRIAAHARDDHGMDHVPPEIEDKIRASIVDR